MASFSLSASDKQLLATSQRVLCETNPENGSRSDFHKPPHGSTRCPLLEIPVEIRAVIYRYLLPTTVPTKGNRYTWLPGNITLLAANQQIYHEAVAIMYGTSTFCLTLWCHFIEFSCPGLSVQFPERIASRNLALIRRYLIHIPNNFGGLLYLAHAVRGQVAKLLDILGKASVIHQLQIHFQEDNYGGKRDQEVLLPFLGLKNTQSVSLFGNIEPNLEMRLQKRLTNAYTKNSLPHLPLELRDAIYHLVLPYTTTVLEHLSPNRMNRSIFWQKGHTAIMRTCKSIYKETSRILYQANDFQFCYFSPTQVWKFQPGIRPGAPSTAALTPYIGAHFIDIRNFTFNFQCCFLGIGEWGLEGGPLDKLNKFLQRVPAIANLTLKGPGICFWCARDEHYGNLAHDFENRLHVRGVGKAHLYGLDTIADDLRMQLESPAGSGEV